MEKEDFVKENSKWAKGEVLSEIEINSDGYLDGNLFALIRLYLDKTGIFTIVRTFRSGNTLMTSVDEKASSETTIINLFNKVYGRM